MTEQFRNLETLRDGVTLIEASAGTGKTYTITALVLRLAIEERVPIERILIVTFTEAATAELQARVRSRLRKALEDLDRLPARPRDEVLAQLLVTRGVLPASEPGDQSLPDAPSEFSRGDEFVEVARRRLALAVTSFDQAAISTIHGFCQRTLRENAFESGIVFDTELVGDPSEMITQAVADFWVNRQHAGDRGFLRHIEKLDISPESLIPLARSALADPEMQVLPDAPPIGETPDFDAWAAAYDHARELWRTERGHIRQLLAAAVSAKRLHGGSYRADYVETRFLEVGALFGGDAFQMAKLPDKLEFFSTSKLRSKTLSGKTTPTHPFFDAVDELYVAWGRIQSTLDDRLIAFKRQLVDFVREELPRRKRAAQIQSFDDLLNQLDMALASEGGERLARAVRARYDVALIDEFQDTDPVQYRIFSRIFGSEDSGRLFLIGDPKQAIYAFRGADIFAYLEAAEAAATRRTLPTNHRSSPMLVAGINSLFERCADPFCMPGITFSPVDTPPSAKSTFRLRGKDLKPLGIYFRPETVPGETDYRGREKRFPSPAQAVAASIVTMLRWQPTFEEAEEGPDGDVRTVSRPVQPGDIAVLVRANWQGIEVQKALQRGGVSCVVQDGSSVFQSVQATDLQQLLRALVEPNRLAAVRAALTTSILGLTGDDLLRLDTDPDEWDRIVDLFREWRDMWRSRGFVHAFRGILSHRLRLRDKDNPESPPAHILRQSDGERRMTNLLHLAELLHDAESTERLSPAGLVRWLAARRVDGGDHDASQLRMESDAAAVKITTIHKSKGLEFPIVYCPYLSGAVQLREDEKSRLRFHDAADDRRLKLALQPDEQMLAQADAENFAESMRLLYVAMTRAKQRCVIVWDAGLKGCERSALAWLLFSQPGDTREGLAKRLRDMGPEGQWDYLTEFVSSTDDIISFRVLSSETRVSLDRSGEQDVKLEVRHTATRVERAWRVTSYSGLIAGSRTFGPGEDGHDHGLDLPSGDRVAGSGGRVRLADFPAGADVGRMLHEVYEHVDFVGIRGPEARIEVDRALGVHGFDAGEHGDTVCRSLIEVVESPLDESGLRLADITRAARLDELGFLFPVRGNHKVAAARIAAVFEAHGGERLAPLADAISRLTFDPFRGFLKGFVDLTFVHEGRWYVVDYKSNDLGPTRDAYERGALDHAMLHGLYHLQYHLYTVALYRYLKWRVPGWDYEKHFGGAYYLFIRGMHPDAGCEFGVFRDRPTHAMVRALDAALDDKGRG